MRPRLEGEKNMTSPEHGELSGDVDVVSRPANDGIVQVLKDVVIFP